MITVLTESLQYRARADTSTLFVAFTGMQLYRSMPEYEWVKSLTALPVNCLFARDVAQFFYLRGLQGVGPDVETCRRYLSDFIAERGFKRLAAVGGSTGGYAALLYGSLLGVDEVHAFTPMTILPSRKLVESYRLLPSKNWTLLRKQLEMRARPGVGRDHRDLRRVLAADNGRTRYHIYYGHSHTPDRRNAERLVDLPRVTLHPYDYDQHYLMARLKKSGEMGLLLDNIYRRLAAAPVLV